MAAPSKSWTDILDAAIAAGKPITTTLMTQIRDNQIHLEEWLGGSFTAAVDHKHDGVDSSLLGNALVSLARATAASSAQIDFTTVIDTTYDLYIVDLVNILPATDDAEFWMRLSDDNGSTFKSGGSDYLNGLHGSSAGASSKIDLSGLGATNGLSNVAGEFYNARVFIWRPAVVDKTYVFVHPNYVEAGGPVLTRPQLGWYNTAAAIDAFRFLMDTGNIAEGGFHLYGVQK